MIYKINEIKERLAEATPGKWSWEPSETGLQLQSDAITYPEHPYPEDFPILVPHVCNACAERGYRCLGPDKGDKEFIAHSREDIEFLLEAVEELMGEVERLENPIKLKEIKR